MMHMMIQTEIILAGGSGWRCKQQFEYCWAPSLGHLMGCPLLSVLWRMSQQTGVYTVCFSLQANTQGSDIAQLRAAGIAVEMDSDQYHMHHKFAVIDGRIVLNGSFNWTRQAVLYNQENVVISDNPVLVSARRTGWPCTFVYAL